MGIEDAVIFEEASHFDFRRKQFPSVDDAYEIYNEYAFMKGLGSELGGVRGERMAHFLWKDLFVLIRGYKDNKCRNIRSYEWLDTRTECLTFVQFPIDR